MPRRSLITAITVVVVLGLLVLLPSAPFVREAIVSRVLRLLDGSGISISYQSSGGNPWRGLTLAGTRVEAPGLSIDVERLRLGYFLPSLLGGELPVDVSLSGVAGDVDLQELLDTLATTGGGGGVSIRLRQIALDDVSINAARLPFTLPDLSIDSLRLEQQTASLLVDASISTATGSVSANGRYDALTGSFTGEVTHADATVAQHWWPGAVGGSASGPVSFRGGLLEGRFQLRDGAVSHDGLDAESVNGEIRLRYPVIEAELSGLAFGGPVSARGSVNVTARRWEATGLATAELKQAADWLVRSQLPEGLPVALSGVGDVQLQLSGWRQVEATGTVSAAGAVEGVALEGAEATFRLPADGVLRVTGNGTLGGAPLSVAIGPGVTGMRTQVRAAGVDLSGAGLPGSADVSVEVEGADGATIDAAWSGVLGGRSLSATMDAELTRDGWSGFLAGSDATGATFEGAAVLRDGRLQGEVTALQVLPDAFSPGGRLSVGADGPLSDLVLTIALAGPEPVRLNALGADSPDLRGAVSAKLQAGRLEALVGSFGPIDVSGALSLAPFAGTISLASAPLSLAAGGAVAASASIASATVELSAEGVRWSGDLVVDDAVLTAGAPLALDVPLLRVDGEVVDDALQVVARSEGDSVVISYGVGDAGGIEVGFSDLQVTDEGSPDEPGTAASLGGRLSAAALTGPFEFQLRIADGSRIGGVPLVAGASLSGRISAVSAGEPSSVAAVGQLGDMPLSLSGRLASDDLALSGTLTTSESATVTVAADSAAGAVALRLDGAIDVPSVLTAFGAAAPLDTVVAGSLAGVWADGSLSELVGKLDAPIALSDDTAPLALAITGRGDRLALELVGEAAGMPVSVVGEAALDASNRPSISATASVGPVSGIDIDLDGASGSGIYELAVSPDAGPEVRVALPWRLEARWATASARLEVADGGFDVALVDGAVRAAGATSLDVYLGEQRLVVAAALADDGPLAAAADVSLTGTIYSAQSDALEPLATFEGPLDGLRLTADVGLERLFEVMGVTGYSPAGTLSLAGVVDVTDTGSTGPRYSADLILSAAQAPGSPPFEFSGAVSGRGAQVSAQLSGSGLDLFFEDGRLVLAADEASLHPLLPEGFSGSLDGALSLQDGAWDGGLRALVTGSGILATAAVAGSATGLEVTVAAEHELASLAAAGMLLPEPVLTGSVTALAGRVTGPVSFEPSNGIEATLVTESFDFEHALLPAQTVRLSWHPGSAIRLEGDGIEVVVDGPAPDANIAGTLNLSARLLGEPAALQAEIGGVIREPRFEAWLIRDGVTATAHGDLHLVTASATLDPQTVARDLGDLVPPAVQVSALIGDTIGISASWRPAEGFAAELTTRVEAGAVGGLSLSLALSGVPDAYGGALSVGGSSGRIAQLDIEGSGVDARAVLDLAAVAWDSLAEQLGLDIEVAGGGSIAVATYPPSANLDIDLRAEVAGLAVGLRGSSTDRLELAVSGQGVEVAGSLNVAERITAVLEGDLRGEPLAVDIEIAQDLVGGHFSATLPGLTASGAVTGQDGRFELTSLTATLTGLPEALAAYGPLELTASGTLSPTTDVRGAVLSTATGETANLRFGSVEPGSNAVPLLTASWRDLAASFDIATTTARITGSMALEDGPDGLSFASVQAQAVQKPSGTGPMRLQVQEVDLEWSSDVGLTGNAAFDARIPALYRLIGIATMAGRLTTDGDGRLHVAAMAGQELSLEATLPSLLKGARIDLSGAIDFALGIHGQLGTLVVAGTPAVGGSLAAPTLTGPLRLSGEISGEGEIDYAAGAGKISLSGDNLTLAAAGAGSDWTADLAITDYPLPDTLPQVGGATVSLHATGTAAPEPFVTVTDLRLAKGASLLTGGAVLNQSVRIALQAQVDLADLEGLGEGEAAARGLLRGPVVLTAATPADLRGANLTAMLDAARLGYGGFGSLSGSLQVGGSISDPRVSALLVGDGQIAGAVRIDASPARGRLSLFSDLAVGGLHTDLDLAIDAGTVRARGIGRFGEAAIFLSDSDSGLHLTGAGRLEGWAAEIESNLAAAEVRGSLASLSSAVTGDVLLTLGSAQGEPWLRGAVAGLAVSGVPLGDLRLVSASPGAAIDLRGDGLSLSLDPASQAWSVAAERLQLPAGLVGDLAGRGTGLGGSVRARLAATQDAPSPLAGTRLDLNVSLADSLSVEGAGDLLGGSLSLSASRPLTAGGWVGQVALSGAELLGLALDVDGLLFGDAAILPNAVLATSLGDRTGQLALTGRLALGAQGVSLDQQLSGSALDGILRVQGRALPNVDLVIGAEPSLAGGGTVEVDGALRLFTTGEGLRSSGQLSGSVGAFDVRLEEGQGGVPRLYAGLPSLGAGVNASLSATTPIALVTETLADGLTFSGTGSASGEVTLSFTPTLSAAFDAFALEAAGFVLSVGGTAARENLALSGELQLPTDVPVATSSGRLTLPWTATLDGSILRVSSQGELGGLEVVYQADAGTLLADIDLAVPGGLEGVAQGALTGGSVRGRLGFAPATGASGSLEVAEVRLTPSGLGPITVAADLAVADGRLGGAATVDTAGGRLSLSGDWSLAGVIPGAESARPGGSVELRVRTLEVSAFPAVAAAAPYASGAVSGVVQFRDGLLLGQLVVPELVLGDERSEATFEITGTPERVVVASRLLGSLFTSELAAGRVSGSARLERFPLELLAESVVGPTDVSADLTGVVRFEVPLASPRDSYLRLATERFLLERAGVVTAADLSLAYQDRELVVERAEFVGRGSWQASGRLSSEVLDFQLDAVEADFTPLLGLVPQLARLGVGAQGSFSFSATGSAADPSIRLVSDGLAFAISGASFEFESADVLLDGDELTAAIDLVSGAPAAGRLGVDGRARLQLDPLALREIDFSIAGSLAAPGFGVIDDISGTITLTPDFLPYLQAVGSLGAPVSISGTLVPLDLRASGTALSVEVPSLLIGRAVVDTDLRLSTTPAGLTLGGSVRAEEVLIDPSAGASRPATDSTAASTSGSTPSESAAARPSTSAPAPRSGTGGLIFDGLRITAPQRVTFDSSFAALEAALDLTLNGNLAEPRLTGTASALRGSLRFAGREFTVTNAVATFNPGRGYYPDLEVVAHADVLKSSALQGARGIEFVAPEGPTLRISLAFSGPVESAPGAAGGFKFDVRPVLSSDALIEVSDGAAVSSVRPLTEAELLTLLTLGRLELNPELVGSGGLGGAVAQGALDTAVDLLIVGELQNALREALGLDVVEIRTSAFSSLLGENAAPFSVSVRFGGYINPDLFASYRIGTRDDAAFGITNEVTLSYGLGPVDIDLSGRLDFPAPGVIASPRPELGFGLRYDINQWLSIDGGLVLSTERSVIRFGVSLRW